MTSLSNGSVTEPLVLKLEEVDVPITVLQENNPNVGRFTASFIVFHQTTNPAKPQVLLIQRGHDGSWGGSWEVPGGGHEPGKDDSILQTALRETYEEAGVHISPDAVFPLVYRTAFWHKESWIASYTFIAEVAEGVPITISDEHLDWEFLDEDDIRRFGVYQKGEAQEGRVMLARKKGILRHFFMNRESLRNGDVDMQRPFEA
ncbi:uncharacterized protein N7484_009953 [Penicillium longicatenatum]|uniref:uncharacterized protein n=1 Tax=Penicillium longicatenatum TaxID=1561947 RepID=UPI0025481A3A|nr:uncharacterized protein N7484_009953 [Penicillium longicatenatum]KAJ5636640.1 hypothetical protein N7484_009953 [Penicillium longicatenatum]